MKRHGEAYRAIGWLTASRKQLAAGPVDGYARRIECDPVRGPLFPPIAIEPNRPTEALMAMDARNRGVHSLELGLRLKDDIFPRRDRIKVVQIGLMQLKPERRGDGVDEVVLFMLQRTACRGCHVASSPPPGQLNLKGPPVKGPLHSVRACILGHQSDMIRT